MVPFFSGINNRHDYFAMLPAEFSKRIGKRIVQTDIRPRGIYKDKDIPIGTSVGFSACSGSIQIRLNSGRHHLPSFALNELQHCLFLSTHNH